MTAKNKLSYRNRRKEPSDVLQHGFEAAAKQFSAEFLRSAPFKHALSKGEEREIPVQSFFREHLPRAFAVTKAEIVDLYETHSPQMDAVIYDQMRNTAFYSGAISILPVEALLVSIEVKSTLTLEEIKTSVNSARKLRQLKPFKKKFVPVRRGGEAAD